MKHGSILSRATLDHVQSLHWMKSQKNKSLSRNRRISLHCQDAIEALLREQKRLCDKTNLAERLCACKLWADTLRFCVVFTTLTEKNWWHSSRWSISVLPVCSSSRRNEHGTNCTTHRDLCITRQLEEDVEPCWVTNSWSFNPHNIL